jgi:hypothetical protein
MAPSNEHIEAPPFRWDSQNVASLLPPGWDRELIDVATRFKTRRTLVPPHSTSREHSAITTLPLHCVGGRIVEARLPWLVDLYRTKFREVGEQFRGEPLTTAVDPRYAVVLNVQVPGERYECHVDTNPVEGLLYVTDHPEGTGGELAVSKNVDARSKEEIDAACVELYPKKGELVLRRPLSSALHAAVEGRRDPGRGGDELLHAGDAGEHPSSGPQRIPLRPTGVKLTPPRWSAR